MSSTSGSNFSPVLVKSTLKVWSSLAGPATAAIAAGASRGNEVNFVFRVIRYLPLVLFFLFGTHSFCYKSQHWCPPCSRAQQNTRMMPPKKKVACVLPSEVVRPEARIKALLQTDGALDHNASDNTDDDTLTHRIPQTSNPYFSKTLAGVVANAEASMRSFEGLPTQNSGQPISFAAPQGTQAEAFTANTMIVDLLP
jgi:hypothetical protein